MLDLCQVVAADGWHGRVRVELRLERGGRQVRTLELQRVTHAAERTPEAVVRALGEGLGDALAAGTKVLREALAGEIGSDARVESAPGR